MQKHFLKYLVDPKTGEDLRLEGDFLVSSKNKYPIVRGVLRFAGYNDDTNYTKSFGYQWNKWSQIQFDSYNKGKKMEAYTLKMWDQINHVTTNDLKGAVIVDVGCGPGRFIETIRDKKGLAIGIDMSDSVEAAADFFKNDPNVLIIQADVLQQPIRDNSVDGTFSIGVLHHTTNPEKGLHEMVRTLKPNGWIGLSLYGVGGYYDNFIVNLYRRFFKKIWPIFRHYPPLIYSYVTVYTWKAILRIPILRTLIRPLSQYTPFMNIKDIDWAVLNTFDSVTPSNQSGHTVYQVYHWMKKAGLKDIEPSNWAGASLHAKK